MLTCKTLLEEDEEMRIYDIENVHVAVGWRPKQTKMPEMNNIDRYRKKTPKLSEGNVMTQFRISITRTHIQDHFLCQFLISKYDN